MLCQFLSHWTSSITSPGYLNMITEPTPGKKTRERPRQKLEAGQDGSSKKEVKERLPSLHAQVGLSKPHFNTA